MMAFLFSCLATSMIIYVKPSHWGAKPRPGSSKPCRCALGRKGSGVRSFRRERESQRELDRDRDTERISLLPPNGNRKRGAAGESRSRGRLGIYEAGDGAAGSGLLDCYGDSGAAQGRAQSVIVEHGCRLTENMAV